MEKKLLIVDASSMLSTCYYGTLPKEIKFAKSIEEQEKYYHKIFQYKGTYTNGVYTMLRMILKIVDKQQPSHIAFCFDKGRDTFRKKIFPDYKGTRKPTPEPLAQQFVLMENILKRIGLPIFMSEEFEADDYAGSLVKKFENEIPCIVMTKDRDYYQLISDKTSAWMIQTSTEKVIDLAAKYSIELETTNWPDNVFEFTPSIIKSEEGVSPEQIVDKKAICGDKSDNIPGVTGVASAAPILLNHYQSIENIYSAIDDCKDESARKELISLWNGLGIKRSPLKALITYKENCFLSKTLSAIKTDIPLDISLSDLEVSINYFELDAIKNELGIKTL